MATQTVADKRAHWDTVYETKSPDSLSWFQPSLRLSLKLIGVTGIPRDAAIIDVGGGASTLVDDLLSQEFSDLTVLDISPKALYQTKNRLGVRANGVRWIERDITELDTWEFTYDLWHDRAVFHFLTKDQERKSYCDAMQRLIRPGGFAIIATFGPNGPLKCSGLDTVRYAPETLQEKIGDAFELIASQTEHHRTPAGVPQEFVYFLLKKSKPQ